MRQATQQDFAQSRQMGVSGFPSVIYRKKNKAHFIARGYANYESMKEILEAVE